MCYTISCHLSIYDAGPQAYLQPNRDTCPSLRSPHLLWGLHGFIFGQSHSSRSNHRRHSKVGGTEYNDAQSFRRKHCHDKEGRKLLVDEHGRHIKEGDVEKHFPNLRFASAECDPCDDSCDFHVTSSNERIGTEEQLRGKDSKQHIPDRKNV